MLMASHHPGNTHLISTEIALNTTSCRRCCRLSPHLSGRASCPAKVSPPMELERSHALRRSACPVKSAASLAR